MTYGPVDFIVLEFKGNQFKGEIIPTLVDMVSNGTIRLIDLVIVQKDKQGKVAIKELQQADDAMIQIFNPLKMDVTGMIKREDLDMVGENIENNSTAAAMLFENLWAIRFKEAAIRANGRLVMQLRIPAEVVDETVKELETVT